MMKPITLLGLVKTEVNSDSLFMIFRPIPEAYCF